VIFTLGASDWLSGRLSASDWLSGRLSASDWLSGRLSASDWLIYLVVSQIYHSQSWQKI
jgi:hypothetical protein